MSPRSESLSINTATLRMQWSLPQIIDGCARHGIRMIAPWRDQVAAAGLKETSQRLRGTGLKLSGYCRGGMFPASDRAGRKAALDDNRRAVDEALTLESPCLVLVVGGLPKDGDGRIASKDIGGAREMVRDGLGDLLEYARPTGMPLAIEPLHPMYAADRACVNTMEHANDLCDELGTGVGIAVDVYHVWWDPHLQRGIERAGGATPSRLLAYHICDWLVPTTDLLVDRGMMGDGVIDLPLIRSWMENAGYRGAHEVEIFSANNWWKRDADEVLHTCKLRHAEVT
ncbi:MAG: sugar phosphate isomerase/epimerase family protein [Betaproteobacteria bacterium]